MEDRCLELELFMEKGDIFGLHQKIKEMAGVYKKKTFSQIRDENNKIIVDKMKTLEVWKNYTHSLFNDGSRTATSSVQQNLEGPEILTSEVRYAIQVSKNNKAAELNNIYAESWKL